MTRARGPRRAWPGVLRTTLTDWRLWVAVVAAGVLAALLGVPPGDSVIVALGALVVGLVLPRLDEGEDASWPTPPEHQAHGRRTEVAAFTWSLAGRDGKVAEPAVRRLREVARRRLARAGLPLSAGFVGPADAQGALERAAARDALGARAWAALSMSDGRLPSPSDVAASVHALEQVLDRAQVLDREEIR